MDEATIIGNILNNSITRYAKSVQSYEIEVANLMAEIIRLQNKIESFTNIKEEKKVD